MHSEWEKEIITSLNLDPTTIGSIMKIQSLKEENYLNYYYGDIAITILKRNLNTESLDIIQEVIKDKANYYKIFKNQKLKIDVLTDDDYLRINYDIMRYIKIVLVSKSNDSQSIDEINKLSKGDFSSLTQLHNNFQIVKKYLKINNSFNEERSKLDYYYDERIKEIEDTNEYKKMLAIEWQEQITNN